MDTYPASSSSSSLHAMRIYKNNVGMYFKYFHELNEQIITYYAHIQFQFNRSKKIYNISTYQQAVGVWRLQRMSGEFTDEFRHSQFIRLPDVIQQTQSVILK